MPDESSSALRSKANGIVVFFTGLPGAGKSTLATALSERLAALTSRPVTVLDGDVVRQHLSSELGFSREHRDLNIRRIGFVAAEVARHGGTCICAAIAPFADARRDARELVSSAGGGFIEVYLETSLEVCERRDPKGLYAKARAGLIKGFTGVDDPYEPPEDAEVVIDTNEMTSDQAVDRILARLRGLGHLA